MKPDLSRLLVVPLLLALSNLASAAITPIDIFHVGGVPGTGGSTSIVGPCYCQEPALVSPVMLLSPGTYDFGTVSEYWVVADPTPDAGPDQPYLFLLFAPIFVAGRYPDDFGSPPSYAYPTTALCSREDAACIADYRGAGAVFDLIETVPPGANAAQVELIASYNYTPPQPSPIPEPPAAGMLVAGLALAAWVSTRRRARDHFRERGL